MSNSMQKLNIFLVVVLFAAGCLPAATPTELPASVPATTSFSLPTATLDMFLKQDCLIVQDTIPTIASLSGYLLG